MHGAVEGASGSHGRTNEGHIDLDKIARLPRVRIIRQDVHPVNLIERAAAVYVVTAQMGFEGFYGGSGCGRSGCRFMRAGG